eukprot:403336678
MPDRTILCPIHEIVSTMPQKIKERENKKTLTSLLSFDDLTVFCDDHDQHKTTLYCKKCSKPVCPRCKFSTHKNHTLISLKKSNVHEFTTNVQKLFDKYSVKNLQSQLVQQSTNQCSLKSSQFKMLLDKIQRVLGNVVSDDEWQQIDLSYYLNGAQNVSHDIYCTRRSNQKVKTLINIQFDDVKHMIQESQTQLRNEFNKTFGTFQGRYDKDFVELKRNIECDLSDISKAFDLVNKKIASSQQMRSKSDQQLQTLFQSVDTHKINLENFTQNNQEQQHSNDQELKKLSNKLKSIDLGLYDLKQTQQAFKNREDNFQMELETVQNTTKISLNKIQSQIDELKREKQNLMNRLMTPQTQSNKKLIDLKLSKISHSNQDSTLQKAKTQNVEEEKSNITITMENISLQKNPYVKENQFMKQAKLSQITQKNISRITQLPSVQECMELPQDGKKKLFRDLVKQEINRTQNSLILSHISNCSTQQFKLLFNGSRDGFTASKFHELCDNKGPTVSFIQSEYGLVFGGYTCISWTSPGNYKSQSDPSAFVFSLIQRSIHKQYQHQDSAVVHNKERMCVFGQDIVIKNDCYQNSNSFSDLGCTYQPPDGHKNLNR